MVVTTIMVKLSVFVLLDTNCSVNSVWMRILAKSIMVDVPISATMLMVILTVNQISRPKKIKIIFYR